MKLEVNWTVGSEKRAISDLRNTSYAALVCQITLGAERYFRGVPLCIIVCRTAEVAQEVIKRLPGTMHPTEIQPQSPSEFKLVRALGERDKILRLLATPE